MDFTEFRILFPKIDQMIANMKMVFLRASSRISLFKEKLDLPLPPKPILPRWGTWVQSVGYYARHFDSPKNFVCVDLDASDAASIAIAQNMLVDPDVRAGLVASKAITSLEEGGISLEESTNLVEALGRDLSVLPRNSQPIYTKFQKVTGGNKGLSELLCVRDCSTGKVTVLPWQLKTYSR